jgi:hypothetical protein
MRLCYHQAQNILYQKLNRCNLQSCVPVWSSTVQTFGGRHDKFLLEVKARQEDDWYFLIF